MNTKSRIVVIAVLFLLKFLFGFWLNRTGKPYNVAILTVHKLISLATVAFIAIAVHRLRGDVGLSAAEISAIIVTGLLFLLAIVSGGLLSIDKPAHVAILLAHKVAPFLSILSTAVMFYLLAI